MGPSAGSSPRHACRAQKCLGTHQHSHEKRCFRHQLINLAPPRRIKVWRDSPLRLRKSQSWHVWYECRLPGIHIRRPQLTATGTRTHPNWSMYQATHPTKMCPSPVTPRDFTYALSLKPVSDLFLYPPFLVMWTPVAQSILTIVFVG